MVTKDIVEAKVLPILQSVWRARHQGASKAPDLMSVLDPSSAAGLLGTSVEYVTHIGGGSRYGFRTAGMLERAAGKIVISTEFKPEEMRFTTAHEVGHLVLHKQQSLFRDRPNHELGLAASKRPAMEVEADHFAACLLMPRNLVRQQFERTFGVSSSFIFDEAWAFQLCPFDPESLLLGDECVVNRALAIARARSFNGRQVHPLQEQFRVTVSAMAIRLIELGLVGESEQYQGTDTSKPDGRIHAPLFANGMHLIADEELELVFASPFARSARRLQLIKSLRSFLQFVRCIGVNCDIWIDGSFATDKLAPDDIDVVVFIYPGQINTLSSDRFAELNLLNNRPLMAEKYLCDVYVERANDDQRRDYYLRTFGMHRGIEKGIPFLRIVV